MMSRTIRILISSSLALFFVSPALASGPQAPPGWGKPKPLRAANGEGSVAFKQGPKAFTLPLNHVEIETKDDIIMVSLVYIDAQQQNRLELYFSSVPKLGKKDPHPITGFVVSTKAGGYSKSSANKSKCDLKVASLTAKAVSGSLTCTGLTDLSAQKPAPDVTGVKFSAKLK